MKDIFKLRFLEIAFVQEITDGRGLSNEVRRELLLKKEQGNVVRIN